MELSLGMTKSRVITSLSGQFSVENSSQRLRAFFATQNRWLSGATNEISLDDFEDWFVRKSWNLHYDSDELAQRSAYAVELRLAEHSSAHLSEPELRRELAPFVEHYHVIVPLVGEVQPVRIQTGTCSSIDLRESPIRSFGIQAEAVSV